TLRCNSRSNPVMTEMTTIKTVIPNITPMIEISVMIEIKVRFGLRYRSARKKLNGSFKAAIAWTRTAEFSRNQSSILREALWSATRTRVAFDLQGCSPFPSLYEKAVRVRTALRKLREMGG